MLSHTSTILLAESTDAWSNFFGIQPGDRFALMVIIIVFGTVLTIALVGIAAGTAKCIHNRRLEAELKRDLLDRGMSAEEVARVVEATAVSKGCRSQRRLSREGIE
jgi:hypothetical protein